MNCLLIFKLYVVNAEKATSRWMLHEEVEHKLDIYIEKMKEI
jgi:hypothetical protein